MGVNAMAIRKEAIRMVVLTSVALEETVKACLEFVCQIASHIVLGVCAKKHTLHCNTQCNIAF